MRTQSATSRKSRLAPQRSTRADKSVRIVSKSLTRTSRSSTSHGGIGTETVRSRLGAIPFKNSYPARDAAAQLRDALHFNRAVETYLTHMPWVSWLRVLRGVAKAGAGAP